MGMRASPGAAARKSESSGIYYYFSLPAAAAAGFLQPVKKRFESPLLNMRPLVLASNHM